MDPHVLHNSIGNITLVDKTGNHQFLSKYDVVLLYFSAHWCPPCREFTPRLKQFYENLPRGSVKIVFVSWDKSHEEFTSYFYNEHGDWLAVNFNSNRQELGQKYGIEGIPALLLINNKTGDSCLSQDMLRSQISSPSTNHLDALLEWEKASVAPYRLPYGQLVKIYFLKSKPEFNGKEGKVVGWKEKRCIVKIGSNEELALKRENLFPIGVKDKLSGNSIIKPVTEDRTQYFVVDSNKIEEIVEIDSIELDAGTPVVLRKLTTTKWNGASGVIQGAMEDEKYFVYMNSREILKIKKANIFV